MITMLANEDKRSINAPCVYHEFNEEKQRIDISYPSVNCNHVCETCGWNPVEKARRLQTGKFMNKYCRKNSFTGEYVELPEGTKSLYFVKQ